MAPIRKSRTFNKQLSKIYEESPVTDVGGNKSKQRKRKVSEMLGSQWSKEELRRFYEAYRKYGTNWKKVSGKVSSRSVEMVEALYNMNKAYLSLPEGIASVVGLVAMMSDHYNISGSCERERESKCEPQISQKIHKRGPGKVQVNISKHLERHVPDFLNCQSVTSSRGCLSLSKKRLSGGNLPRVVGKRTPRFAIPLKRGVEYVSPNKQDLKSVEESNVEKVSHGVLALTKALHRGHTQVSQTPNRRSKHSGPSAVTNYEQHAEVLITSAKHIGTATPEDCWKDSFRSRESENGNLARHSTDKVEGWRKQKKAKLQETETNHFYGVKETCSRIGKLNMSLVEEKAEAEAANSQIELSSSEKSLKRSRQLVSEDESSALQGLHALADALIEMEPDHIAGSDLSMQVEKDNMPLDISESCKRLEPVFAQPERDKPKTSQPKQKGHHMKRFALKTAEGEKIPDLNVSLISDAKQWLHQSTLKRKRKHRSIASKNLRAASDGDIILCEPPKTEAIRDEGKTATNKPKWVTQSVTLSKVGKSIGHPESSSSSANQQIAGNHLAVPVGQDSSVNQVKLPTKLRNRRKMHLPKALVLGEIKSVENITSHGYNSLLHSRAQDPKEKLSCCLSSQILRRWCTFEWFYSAIDYPWFAKREFMEYLNHVGLGHMPRLTRVEWGVIRSSLGKPRRLSQQFLREEKEKLDNYRESVRTHYTELRAGNREVLPSDLALPLSVGQRVIACHPKTREIHNGSILTVERNRCRVQFKRPELGVEFVMDIDCMPLDPLENIPYALRRDNISVTEECLNFKGSTKSRPVDWKIGGRKYTPNDKLHDTDDLCQISLLSYSEDSLFKLAKGNTIRAVSQAQATRGEIDNILVSYAPPCYMTQNHAVLSDIEALAKLSVALHKKEVLVSELRDMNHELLKSQNVERNSLMDSKNFKDLYGAVIVQLKGANEQVSSALLYLRQHNTLTPGPKHLANSCSSDDHSVGRHAQESGSNVVEVVETSRIKAQKMVDVAILAISSLKDGEDALRKIGEALHFAESRHSVENFGLTGAQPFASMYPDCSDSRFQDRAASCMSELMMKIDAIDSKPTNASEQIATQIPSALITSCVAALLMIQACADRQYPPAEAAHILDSAIQSLKPCCSQNIPIYRDIEMCMGMVKNQILALIPT